MVLNSQTVLLKIKKSNERERRKTDQQIYNGVKSLVEKRPVCRLNSLRVADNINNFILISQTYKFYFK